MKKRNLGQTAMLRLVLEMSWPLMLSLLVQSLYNIVDSIFVAMLSEKALTATSLAFPVQIMMIAVSVGTSVGVNSLLSRSLGAGDKDRTGRTAGTAALLAVWLNKVKNPQVVVDFRGFQLQKSIVFDIYKVGLPTILMQAMGSLMVMAVNGILMPFGSLFGLQRFWPRSMQYGPAAVRCGV